MIDLDSIWKVVEFVEEVRSSPEKLTESTYPEPFKELIRKALNVEKAKKAVGTSIEDLETQIADIYTELDDFKDGLDSDEEGKLFVQYMRLRAALLTKMVEIKERVYSLKTMKTFQDRVVAIMDTLLTPDQRTKFMTELAK